MYWPSYVKEIIKSDQHKDGSRDIAQTTIDKAQREHVGWHYLYLEANNTHNKKFSDVVKREHGSRCAWDYNDRKFNICSRCPWDITSPSAFHPLTKSMASVGSHTYVLSVWIKGHCMGHIYTHMLMLLYRLWWSLRRRFLSPRDALLGFSWPGKQLRPRAERKEKLRRIEFTSIFFSLRRKALAIW